MHATLYIASAHTNYDYVPPVLMLSSLAKQKKETPHFTVVAKRSPENMQKKGNE